MSGENMAPEQDTAFLEMSDEELLAFDPSQLSAQPPVEGEGAEAGEGAGGEPAEAPEQAPQPEAETDDTEGEGSDDGEAPAAVASPVSEVPATPAAETVAPAQGEGASLAQAPEVVIDYKAEYERLTAPFKANGRDITVKSVDDAIALMQMGANYSKKMAALKPNLKLMKLLENNGLLDEGKLSYLIDLDKKSPEAISKLIKDSGLDPLDLDADKASGYKPGAYAVDDRELELDAVLDEIQGTAAYNRTLDVVSNKWDGPSKQVIAQSPQLLKVINDHVERGIYDLITREIESERLFGRLNGLSDIEAYRRVGDAIQARGGFDHLGQPRTAPSQQTPAAAPVAAPNPSKADEDRLRDKRRAASAPRPSAASPVRADFNPLALSDEDFARVAQPKYG